MSASISDRQLNEFCPLTVLPLGSSTTMFGPPATAPDPVPLGASSSRQPAATNKAIAGTAKTYARLTRIVIRSVVHCAANGARDKPHPDLRPSQADPE